MAGGCSQTGSCKSDDQVYRIMFNRLVNRRGCLQLGWLTLDRV